MKVKLDLRPRSLVEKQSKKVNIARILIVALFVAFLMVAGATFALSFMKVRGMDAEIAMLNDQVALQKAQSLKLGNEIKRLGETEKMYLDALALLQEELPALEFLESVERSLPEGVWLASLAMDAGRVTAEKGKQPVPGKATIRGGAYVENDVVHFAKGLQDAPVVSAVDFPVTSRVEREDEPVAIVDFTLSCTLRNMEGLRVEE
ncbi:MAG TPA: hypothetical protein DIC53_08005, partial [Synergistaceae bacterium]|nr:hypothetical protein [Synergistaceae bacterium]